MRDVSIGQYYPSDSFIHRLDPRIKLIASIIYIVMLFFIDTFIMYGVVFICVIIAVLFAKVPLLKVLRSLKYIIFLIIFTLIISILFYSGPESDILYSVWVIKIYKTALINSGKLAARITLLVLGPSLLTLTTTPVELTDALERLLKPLTYIKVPVHEITIIMSIALRLIPTLIDETDKIMSAQKARGAAFDSGNIFKRAKALLPVLIPLFISSFRRAEDLAYAMDSRCYRGAKGRTRMKVMRLKALDIFIMLLFLVGLFVILAVRYNAGWFNFAFITHFV